MRSSETTSTNVRSPIAALVVIASVPIIWAYIALRPAMDRSKLAQIAPGTSKWTVVQLLGLPRYGDNHENDWDYQRWGNQGYVRISFDDHGRVVTINDESVFPARSH